MTSESSVIPILMPEAGNTMEEGTVLSWNVQPGDRVSVGDILCEIETDKAAMEYESPAAGRLARITAAEGDTVAVKEPIAYLAESDAELDSVLAASPPAPGERKADSGPSESMAESDAVLVPGSTVTTESSSPSPAGSSYPASPAVRRRARQLGIALPQLGKGSGPRGRIITADLERWRIEATPSKAQAQPTASSTAQRRPLSKMRRRIGERLVAAKQLIPHFYVRTTVLADEMVRVVKGPVDSGMTFNDLVVFACGKALLHFPGFRSRIEGQEIVEESGANIGIAVGLDEGLVVPVIRDVQDMSLDQLSVEIKRIAEDARRGVVAGAGTGVFTISNLGMYGVDEFSAIINPPESGILAVGAIRDEVIVENGAMRPGRVMTVTLSADHRVVDGVMAAKFMAELKKLLENAGRALAGESY